jgi:hypothetical protein
MTEQDERLTQIRQRQHRFSGIQDVVVHPRLQWPWTSTVSTNGVIELVRDIPYLLDRLAASEQEAARLRAVLDWTEALEAWASNALGIVKDQRIPSADVIADGEAILAGVREALGPVKEDQADATE